MEEQKKYTISDASKKLELEAHVLRYWEEELGLKVSRNELGHRFYTERDLEVFRRIKKFKEQGLQLKAIKAMLPQLRKEVPISDKQAIAAIANAGVPKKQEVAIPYAQAPKKVVSHEKVLQFQTLLKNMIRQAIEENNEKLSHQMGEVVTGKVIKEMDYLFRLKEEEEEERFKKLDERLRSCQNGLAARAKGKKENSTIMPYEPKKKKRSKFFHKQEEVQV